MAEAAPPPAVAASAPAVVIVVVVVGIIGEAKGEESGAVSGDATTEEEDEEEDDDDDEEEDGRSAALTAPLEEDADATEGTVPAPAAGEGREKVGAAGGRAEDEGGRRGLVVASEGEGPKDGEGMEEASMSGEAPAPNCCGDGGG